MNALRYSDSRRLQLEELSKPILNSEETFETYLSFAKIYELSSILFPDHLHLVYYG